MLNLIWAIPATLGIVTIWAVSAVANYEYGLTQGTADPVHILWLTVTTSQMNGYASLAVDVLKAVLPATAVVAWVLRKRAAAMGVAAMFLLCLGWSAQNSVGYVLSNHSRAVDGRGQTADQWRALQQSLDETERSRGMVPEHRPYGVVKAEIDSTKADARFAASTSCSDPAAGKALNFCRSYRGLTAEIAAAESADRLDVDLKELRRQLDQRKRVSDSDPLGTAAAAAFGFHRESVVAGRGVSFSLLVELISAVGLALIWGTYSAAVRDNREKAAAAPVSALPAAEWTRGAIKVTVSPEAAPEAPAPVKPRPTTPSGTRKTMKPAEAADDARDNVVHISERSELMMPEFASKFFEESAPPAKTKRKYDMRKRKSMGAAKDWIAERTERSRQPGIACLADEAWNDYYSWCEDGGKTPLPRSKIDRVLQARFGSIILRDGLRDGRGYVGLLLTDDESERRAVA